MTTINLDDLKAFLSSVDEEVVEDDPNKPHIVVTRHGNWWSIPVSRKPSPRPESEGLQNEVMRAASGRITSTNPLVCLLYLLMRDKITPGAMETTVDSIDSRAEVYTFSNGWLAQHAIDIVKRLSR